MPSLRGFFSLEIMKKKSFHPDPFFQRFFDQIPPEIAHTFTPEQLQAIKRIYGDRSLAKHAVNLRLSMPIPGLRFYLILLLGKEQRSRARIIKQSKLYPIWTRLNAIAITVIIVLLMIFVFACAYFVLNVFGYTVHAPYPAVIPWIDDQYDCENSGRIWEWDEGKCLDQQHSPQF